MTLNLGFSSLILEGDFIEAIGSKEPNFKKGDVIIEIQSLLYRFEACDMLHVDRQGTKAAHLLAMHACFVDDIIL